jgi:hypothetical protein
MAADPRFDQFHISRTMHTRELILECTDLTPPDEYGRRVPAYVVLHQALMAYRTRLLKEKAHAPVHSTPLPEL